MSDELGGAEPREDQEVPEDESDVDEQLVDLIPNSELDDEDNDSLPSPP
jgi:hypothetical protein